MYDKCLPYYIRWPRFWKRDKLPLGDSVMIFLYSISLDPQVQPSLIEDPEFVFGDYEYSEEEEPFYG